MSPERITLSESVSYTATAEIYALVNGVPGAKWAGSGTYDVYLVLGDYQNGFDNLAIYMKPGVSFATAATTIAANDFVAPGGSGEAATKED